jgi:ferritin-like protein
LGHRRRRNKTMAKFQGMSDADKLNDIQILNQALFFENRAVWAYNFAAGKLSTSEVGKTVLELGLQNRADHEKHQEMMGNAIRELGGTPVQMEKNYDLSSYINKGRGNVDSDVNIAKLALALEIGAAVGYVSDTTKLKSPYMIEMEAGIACIEAIHAARIRAAFNALGINIPVVPSALISTSDRDSWVIRVDRAA